MGYHLTAKVKAGFNVTMQQNFFQSVIYRVELFYLFMMNSTLSRCKQTKTIFHKSKKSNNHH